MVSLPIIANSVFPLGIGDVVTLVNVTRTNPLTKSLPPGEILQIKDVLFPTVGFCAKASDPGKKDKLAINTVSASAVNRFIVFPS